MVCGCLFFEMIFKQVQMERHALEQQLKELRSNSNNIGGANGVAALRMALEENDKLKAEIETLRGIISKAEVILFFTKRPSHLEFEHSIYFWFCFFI